MTFDAAPGYLSADDCRLADLIDLVSRKTDLADYPYASTVEQNVLIYGWTGPSSGSRRAPRLTSSAGPCQNNGHGSNWRPNSVRGAPAARPGGTPTPRRRSADDQLR
jgi:hypothetical protein